MVLFLILGCGVWFSTLFLPLPLALSLCDCAMGVCDSETFGGGIRVEESSLRVWVR